MTPVENFLWGAMGAFLPLLYGWAKSVMALTPLPVVFGGYAAVLVAVTILFVAAGGVVAVAWKPENPLKGLWVGASAQLLVASFAQNLPQSPP